VRLATQVADTLRAAIAAGTWAAGTRLPPGRVLAGEFGVSRAVMREAMAVLGHLGLVAARQGSGVFVADPLPTAAPPTATGEQGAQAVLEQFELRRAIEVEAAALAARRCTPDALARIQAARDALNRRIDEGVESVEEGFAFHREIVRASGNPQLVKLLDDLKPTLFGTMRVMRENAGQRERFTAEVRREHDDVVEAIAAGDPERARQAALTHFAASEVRIRATETDIWTAAQPAAAADGQGAANDGRSSGRATTVMKEG